jgi:arginine decarboxylase
MLDQSQTPLLSALAQRVQVPYVGFHTPGHQQGRGCSSALLGHWGAQVLSSDLAEIPGLDQLAAPAGAIAAAQNLAAEAFGADHTWFLVNGSSVGVMAAILATCQAGDVILLPRNAHQSVISGVILAGVTPVLITPDFDRATGLVFPLTPALVATALDKYPQAKTLLVVSPTYEGLCADLPQMVAVARTLVPHLRVIVDEAHGPHLHFHPDLPRAALDAGADLVVQSTHKVLSACTQAAMLHLRGNRVTPLQVGRVLRLLQSSSPSYLLLASLDAARQQIATQGQLIYTDLLAKAVWVRQALAQMPGLRVIDPSQIGGETSLDLTRITLDVRGLGLTGYEVDDLFDQTWGITAELPSLSGLTFILTLGNSQADLERLVAACQTLLKKEIQPQLDLTTSLNPLPTPQISPLALSPRQAFFGEPQTVPWADAVGQISADWICPYPPGIPVLLPGEAITAEALDYLRQAHQAGASLTGCQDVETLQVIAAPTRTDGLAAAS